MGSELLLRLEGIPRQDSFDSGSEACDVTVPIARHDANDLVHPELGVKPAANRLAVWISAQGRHHLVIPDHTGVELNAVSLRGGRTHCIRRLLQPRRVLANTNPLRRK